MEIYLLRHHRTEENSKGIISGQLNIDIKYPLSKISNIPTFSKGKKIYIFSSTLKRCKKTSELLISDLLNDHDNISVIYSSKLKERNMGEWEGEKKKEIILKNSDQFYKNHFIPILTPPNGESFELFLKRVNWLISEINKINNHPIIICSHNQFLKLFIHKFFKDTQLSQWGNTNLEQGKVTSINNFHKLFN